MRLLLLLPVSGFALHHGVLLQAQVQAIFLQRSAASAAQQRPNDKDAKAGLQVQQEEFDAVTDQIPLRPVGAVEATSYTFLILAGLGLAGLCTKP